MQPMSYYCSQHAYLLCGPPLSLPPTTTQPKPPWPSSPSPPSPPPTHYHPPPPPLIPHPPPPTPQALTYFFVYGVRQGACSWLVFYLINEKGVTDVADVSVLHPVQPSHGHILMVHQSSAPHDMSRINHVAWQNFGHSIHEKLVERGTFREILRGVQRLP